jgi:hypothetical protein
MNVTFVERARDTCVPKTNTNITNNYFATLHCAADHESLLRGFGAKSLSDDVADSAVTRRAEAKEYAQLQ